MIVFSFDVTFGVQLLEAGVNYEKWLALRNDWIATNDVFGYR